MVPSTRTISMSICSLIIAALPLFGEVKMRVEGGRPVVDGVYVNGHGPYRFLVDTGSNVNLIEIGLARKIGMNASFRTDLASTSGKTPMAGCDGNEVALDSVKAGNQKFLLTGLEAVHQLDPEVRGVLGQWFLGNFDYRLDVRGKRVEFGKQERGGVRTPFKWVNARPVVRTSLGDLVVDSASARLVLFGVEPDVGDRGVLRTYNGSRAIGTAWRKLEIEGRSVWHGDAVTMASQTEPGIAGLLPLSLFRAIYICNTERYVVLE